MIETVCDPTRLFAFEALPMKAIDGAIELEEDPAKLFQFLNQGSTQRKGAWRNAPVLVGEQAVGRKAIADEAGADTA